MPRSARLSVLTLGVLIFALSPAAASGQLIKSFSSFDGGTLRIDFGGLEKVGSRIRPRQMHQEIEPTTPGADQTAVSIPIPVRSGPTPEEIQGRALVEKGMRAFSEARWAEAIELLGKALTYLPRDVAIGKTLTAAQIGLRYEEQAERSAEEAARQASEDASRLGVGVERLSEALNSLRLEASQALIDRGQFQAAVRLSTRADFVFDSSVVDLRQARQGVVDFEVLKPPASRSGRIDFSTPPRRSEAPGRQRARQLLDHPAVEAVMFYERVGDAIGYAPSEAERQDRYSDPVTRAVADHLNINLRNATREERDFVAQKTREVWNAYDRSKARQDAENSEVGQRSVQTFNAMLDRLKGQGILKPGEDLLAKEKKDPTFRALMKSEVKAIVLEDNVGRREVTKNSFDKLLGDVGSILERKGKQ
jgi:hypothetical protein